MCGNFHCPSGGIRQTQRTLREEGLFMVYENCKIGNPILCKDGRLRIYIKYSDGQKSVMSYPKYLMEVHLNRYLEYDETVDHIDGNPLNNKISNLQILDRSKHVFLDIKRLKSQNFICPMCGKCFTLTHTKLHNAIQNRKRGSAGPFCSKSCAGKYGAEVQNGRQDVLSIILIKPIYITLKHSGALITETYKVDTANSGKPSSNADGNPELG